MEVDGCGVACAAALQWFAVVDIACIEADDRTGWRVELKRKRTAVCPFMPNTLGWHSPVGAAAIGSAVAAGDLGNIGIVEAVQARGPSGSLDLTCRRASSARS